MKTNSNQTHIKIRIGVSSCLLGNPVRYDGSDRRHDWLVDQLALKFELIALCPEVEAGLGLPREPVQLVLKNGAVRVVGENSKTDRTEQLTDYISRRLKQDDIRSLAGFVLKSKSPSCGSDSVRLIDSPDQSETLLDGLFAEVLKKSFPELPLIDEKQLDDEKFRVRFIELVRQYALSRNLPGAD